MNFGDFAAAVPGNNDYLVGYAVGGGAGSDRRFLRSDLASPAANDGLALGTTALGWSDLFLAAGGVLNWNNGVATLFESSGNVNLIITTASAGFAIQQNDSGGNGPVVNLFHNSSSPANSDNVCQILANGNSSTGVQRTYGAILNQITDTTNTSEDALWDFYAMKAGTSTLQMRISNGLFINQPGVALSAGGSTTMAFQLSSSAIGIYAGSGAPSISAAKGSLYLRSDGTTTNNRAYINTDGGTTWTAITTVG